MAGVVIKDNFIEELRREHILIVGISARTGLAVARYFGRQGVKFSLSDRKSEEECGDILRELGGMAMNEYFGFQSVEQLEGVDRIILSPGVWRGIPLIQEAIRVGIPVMGDVELAYRLSGARGRRVIGVTGTDGKSMTVSLVVGILKGAGYSVKLVGNIGTSWISLLEEEREEDIVVIELSSYMLESIDQFRCGVGCVLNISEAHGDRYSGMGEYIRAKKNIFKNQDQDDYCILNVEDKYFEDMRKDLKGRLVIFSGRGGGRGDAYIEGEDLKFQGEVVVSRKRLSIQGDHHLENVLAAICIAKVLGVGRDWITKGLEFFQNLKHRMEDLGKVKGVRFINDSKATTNQAVRRAIMSIGGDGGRGNGGRMIILLMGGQGCCVDGGGLGEVVRGRVKHLIIFGGLELDLDLGNFLGVRRVKGLEEGFKWAWGLALEGDVILLSPGGVSFDDYRDYEERGEHFRGLFERLKGQKG